MLNVIKQVFGSYKLANHGDEIRVCCPKCHDRRYRLYINIRRGCVHCFNCEFRGNVSTVLSIARSVKQELIQEEPSVIDMPQLFPITVEQTDLWRYATSRLSYEEIALYKISYTTRALYLNRIIIPITLEGEVVYFQARTILQTEKVRYLNPARSHTKLGKSEVVFGLDLARSIASTCVITEGIFSAIAIPRNGTFAGVAILGKYISDTQLHLLVQASFSRYIVMLDPDALSFAIMLVEKLLAFNLKVSLVILEKGDPADQIKENLLQQLEQTRILSEFDLLKLKLLCLGD